MATSEPDRQGILDIVNFIHFTARGRDERLARADHSSIVGAPIREGESG